MVRALSLLLLSHKLRIDAFGIVLDQRLMVTDFHDLACLHYNNLISILDSRESMSDNYSGNMATKLLPNLINCGLNLSFVSFVKSTGCLVK
jgi:hypothetical protein